MFNAAHRRSAALVLGFCLCWQFFPGAINLARARLKLPGSRALLQQKEESWRKQVLESYLRGETNQPVFETHPAVRELFPTAPKPNHYRLEIEKPETVAESAALLWGNVKVPPSVWAKIAAAPSGSTLKVSPGSETDTIEIMFDHAVVRSLEPLILRGNHYPDHHLKIPRVIVDLDSRPVMNVKLEDAPPHYASYQIMRRILSVLDSPLRVDGIAVPVIVSRVLASLGFSEEKIPGWSRRPGKQTSAFFWMEEGTESMERFDEAIRHYPVEDRRAPVYK